MFQEATNKGENAGYNLGTALRNLGSGLGSLSGQLDVATSADSGFVRFVNLLTTMVNAIDSLGFGPLLDGELESASTLFTDSTIFL